MTDTPKKPAGEGRLADEPNHDPYRKRRHRTRFNKVPWSAYFFYFGPEKPDQPRRFDRYYYASHHGPIRRKNLRKLITQLALNARLPERSEQNPPPHPKPTELSKWTRKSYLIALVDDPTFRFTRDAAIAVDVTGRRTPNHTFFDAKDFNDIELPGPTPGTIQKVSAVCVINHMKKANEEDLIKGEEEKFLIKFNPGPVPVRPPVEDDGGKNVGPPVPPP